MGTCTSLLLVFLCSYALQNYNASERPFHTGCMTIVFFMNILAVSLYHLSRRKHFTTLRTRIFASFVHVKVVSFCITFLRKLLLHPGYSHGTRVAGRFLDMVDRTDDAISATETGYIHMPCCRDIRT